ncbi:NAD(P)-dependent oxidoreductase [Halostella sp. JP-L12]|uniref:NAD-dependent epimerase/dehydratase family protein n=1 Tax=Halostella TaxID=1843185 RepID=UPI000EF81746|nr:MULTISPECIES: NAD(P)-dependent oxidoreductase [Halostella]NHN47501.1 NAD(P)-dependent oxidoreductase [Halostella sp. JP-L12]
MDTVAVTGGNGELGRAVLEHLGSRGYRTVNLNRGKRREDAADEYLTTDLTDAGETYGSLARSDADAVAHLGMIPTPERTPGYVTFESNAMSTYHVLEAAASLGIDTVVLASSLSVLGAGFEEDPVDVRYLPVDEEHPITPTTSYGLGKQTLEVVADGFGRADGPPTTVSSIRFPWVTSESAMRETFAEPDRSLDALRERGAFHTARNTLFAYLPIDDAARAVRRAVEADFAGHERFFAVADDTAAALPSAELADRLYADAERRSPLSGHESLISNEKAGEVLGWAAERSWRELV